MLNELNNRIINKSNAEYGSDHVLYSNTANRKVKFSDYSGNLYECSSAFENLTNGYIKFTKRTRIPQPSGVKINQELLKQLYVQLLNEREITDTIQNIWDS